jgi:hypothetical protein
MMTPAEYHELKADLSRLADARWKDPFDENPPPSPRDFALATLAAGILCAVEKPEGTPGLPMKEHS